MSSTPSEVLEAADGKNAEPARCDACDRLHGH